MSAEWIFGWWNLVYLAPFLLALIYLGVYAASGITFGDADVDADASAGDFDHDADIAHGHDLHVDSAHPHVEAGHGQAGHDGHHGPTGQQQTPGYLSALTWLGIGRVPLSLVLMVLLMLWGFIGFAANVLGAPYFASPEQTLLMSLPIALLASMALTSAISRMIVRYVPLSETDAKRHHEMLGCVGEAVFAIDHASGVVAVRDEQGGYAQYPCRVDEAQPPIPKGSKVKLVGYNGPNKLFYAVPWDAAAESQARAARA